jgi:lipopolysaccharide export system permease protein
VQVGILLTVVTFLLGEMVLPSLHAKANHVKEVRINKATPTEKLRRANIWLRGKERRIYHVRRFDPEIGTLFDVSLFEFNADFQVVRRTDIEQMAWQGDHWRLVNSVETRFGPRGEMEVNRLSVAEQRLPESLESFHRVEKRPADMNAVELRRYIRRMRAEGSDVSGLRSDLHAKFATPFASLVLTLLAIPFAVHNPRSAGIGRSLATGLALALAYWFLLQLGLSLGHAGKLPPMFAAWLGNLFFAAFGIYQLIHIRQ